MNTLYYGDNLDILRSHIATESVDLEYLDPPFNSNRSFNVLFRETTGKSADAQITAFDDTWHWGPSSEQALSEINQRANPVTVEVVNAIVSSVKRNDVAAYLVMMAVRLIELHRVLKPTGSIYLHCDPTASHYLKVIMDTIFGPQNFRSEITWLRSRNPKGSQHAPRQYSPDTDTILYYARERAGPINYDRIKTTVGPDALAKKYDRQDDIGAFTDGPVLCSTSMGPRPNLVYEYKGYTPGPSGWRMVRSKLEELDRVGNLGWSATGKPYRKLRPSDDTGNPVGNCWTDISSINPQAAERLGYPTQKPLALLERIVLASSNPDDILLDAFCGCGTAIIAAQKHGRQWVGIDITHLAVGLMRSRLEENFPDVRYEVVGVPADVASATALAIQDRHEFEHWALGLVPARSSHGDKKGADQGVDGVAFFQDTAKGEAKKVVVQVKSGHVQRNVIGDLLNSMSREKAVMAFLVTLEPGSKPMHLEAIGAGYYESPGWGRHYERVQIRTVEELLAGKRFDYPPANITFNKANRESAPMGTQGELL